MHRRFISSAVVIFAFATHAAADSIRFVATVFENVPGAQFVPWTSDRHLSTTSTLDMTQLIEHGGSMTFGSDGLPLPYPSAPAYRDLSGGAFFEIGVAANPSDQGSFSNAYQLLNVNVMLQGSLSHGTAEPGDWAAWGGGYATTNVAINSFGPGATPPPALLDLLQHPDRIHFTGVVQKAGSASYALVTTLTIDPPTPDSPTTVPEPGMIAIVGIGLAVVMRRHRGQAAGTEPT